MKVTKIDTTVFDLDFYFGHKSLYTFNKLDFDMFMKYLQRLPECMSKSHDSVTDELELSLKLGVLLGQPLLPRAQGVVTLIVRSAQSTRVAAVEVVLPKF